MRTLQALALVSALLAAGCNSDVATIQVRVLSDGSGTVNIDALKDVESHAMTSANVPAPMSGLQRGQIADFGVSSISATFQDIRAANIGGITFDWTDGKGERVLRVSLPAKSDAPWRKLLPSQTAMARAVASKAARAAQESRPAKPTERDRERSTVLDFRIELPGDIVAQSLDEQGKAVGWRCECDDPNSPCTTVAHLIIPITPKGNEPERIVWELRSKVP